MKIVFLLGVLLVSFILKGQENKYQSSDNYLFVTNRPYKIKKEKVKFKNYWTRSNSEVNLVDYYFKNDSNVIISTLKHYEIDTNFEKFLQQKKELSDFYRNIIEEHNINEIVFVIPGYGKDMYNLTRKFIPKLENAYHDSLKRRTLFITYAWGNETSFFGYYSAHSSAFNAAQDYTILHALLQEWLHDPKFGEEQKKRDLRMGLICLSMGNRLLAYFLQIAKEIEYDVKPIFDYTFLLGCDVPNNAFEPNKPFATLNSVSRKTYLFINRYDIPLSLSGTLSFKRRMGKHGPKNEEFVPKSVELIKLKDELTFKDLKGLHHDYFFTNEAVKHIVIEKLNNPE